MAASFQLTQPVVHPKVGLRIRQQNRARTHDSSELVQGKERHDETNVGERDPRRLTAAEDGAVWREVALAEDAGRGLLETAGSG